jgi:hypothetical protein
MQHTNNEELPLMYLNILELCCLIPKIPMQIRINNNEVIGDIRPVKTFPKLSGFFTITFSISWLNLRKKFRKIKRQNNAINIIIGVVVVLVRCDFSELITITKRILKAMNTAADECGIGIYFSEKEANPSFPDTQPNKLIPAIIIIINRSDSFLLII